MQEAIRSIAFDPNVLSSVKWKLFANTITSSSEREY